MLLAQQDGRPLIDFTLAPLLEDSGVPLAVMGMLVVFMALTLIVVFITLLPRLLAPFSGADRAEGTALLPVDDDELSEEMVVVIAAAVAQAMERPHRIVRIQGLTPIDLGWSLEGRMQHHQSHQIQRRARR
jgi:Na+-transporting methylmalonyl-CoA/oxaloacetate decarboxylase gamma subunit